jgi:hypothetical protein
MSTIQSRQFHYDAEVLTHDLRHRSLIENALVG